MPGLVSFTKQYHNTSYPAIDPARPELSAAGKNVIVSGGGTGIGKAIATAFAQAGAASVAILGRREDKLKSAADDIQMAKGSTKVLYKAVDLVDRAATAAAFKEIVAQVGATHIFVSNAGTTHANEPAVALAEQDFISTFDSNVRGPLNAVFAFVPIAAPDAVLISINSGFAHMAPIPGYAGYSAAKAANLKLFDFVAAENPQLRVFSVQPCLAATAMNGFSPDADQDSCKCMPFSTDAVDLPGCFCVWLASDEARFLAGRYVWANWDVDELVARKDEILNSRLLKAGLYGVEM